MPWRRWRTPGRRPWGGKGIFDFQVAEFSTIGCLLLDEKCLAMVRPQLPGPEAFQNAQCRRAYEAICTLSDGQRTADILTIGREAALDHGFLSECMQLVPSCAGAENYARTVAEGYRRRCLRALGERLQEGGLCLEEDLEGLLAEARDSLEQLTAPQSGIKTPGDSLRDFLAFRQEVNEGRRQTVRVGFPALDGILGGFAPGGLYILAARPGVGKSALGIAMGDMLAKTRQVLYVSLEMTEQELNARRLAAFSASGCTFNRLLFEKTDEATDVALLNACSTLAERKLLILAAASMTVAQLENRARSCQAEVVMVDYLGLLSGPDPKASEYERVTRISGDLKRMAKRLGCVVIALCQLNREAAAPGGETPPRLSQLRSSGAIEQDADGVLLLHRPEYAAPDPKRSPAAPQPFLVDVAKNRHGRTGRLELQWYAPVNRFEDRSGRWPEKSWM